jgi:hypothetical protein
MEVPFKVVEMEGKYLKQLAGNHECELYVMWAMLHYIGRKSKDEGKYLKQLVGNHECGLYVMWAMLHYIGGKSKDADNLVCIIPILFMSVNNSTK